jgi:tripartite-type tricarboxylate transporter receptor subunit TctC
VLFTAADSPYKSVKDVVDHARSGQGRWGAANPASLERQTMERLKQKAGVNAAVATFEGGGDMLINVLNHTLDMGVGELQEMRGQLDAGKIRLLGVVGDERMTQFPDVQTVKEQGIDLSVRKFRGLAGPKGMPRDLITRWEVAVRTLLDDPEYKKLYFADGLQPGFMPHDEYVAFMNTFGNDTATFLKESGVIR